MKSCIYKGLVKHQRFLPRLHEFSYSLFMMYIDLDELDTLFNGSKFWSIERSNLAAFKRIDHHGNADTPLKDSIRELVLQKTGKHSKGPIRLLTHFRYFGYVFNPLSLFFCYDEKDEKVEFVVAEVMNTPWREQHCYVLSNIDSATEKFQFSHQKEFHVSPFMDLDMRYDWNIRFPGHNLNVQLSNWKNEKKLFDAVIGMKKIEINNKNLKNVLLNFPLMTVKVTASIYFEAFKLWMKRIQYVPHPDHKVKL